MVIPKDEWPVWAREHFAREPFQPFTIRHALAMRVLVVATTRIEGTWAAYCDAVPGMCHECEEEAVLRTGDKVPESMARALFPDLDFLPYST